MKDQFEKIIYNWVKQNFGESEAKDPSWSIEALAEEIVSHYGELNKCHQREALKETAKWVAQYELDMELTEEEIDDIVSQYLADKEDKEAYYNNEEQELRQFIEDYTEE